MNHPSVPVRLASVVALRRRHARVVDRYLADDHEWVVAEAARAIHDDTSIPAALPALARLLDTRPTNDVVLRRALNANLRLGDVDGARRLLDYALDSSSTAAFRQEALSILREWPSPPRLDRVDGRARTIRTVSIASVLTPALDRLLALNDSALKTLAVEILLAHQLEPTAAQVAQIVEDSAAPAALRAQALRLLIQQHPRSPELAEALQRALADDAEEPIFAVAVAHLRQHDGDRFVAVARQALQQRSVPVQQDLVQGLAELATPAADAVLVELGQALAKGELSPPLQLDVLNALAVRANAHAGLAELHQAYQRSSAAKQRQELLAGGDVSSGREIALNHLGANCLACHRIEADQGSAVGPSLHDVGARLDAAGVLRALVEPNAELAPGYGLVAVTLKSGDVSSGGLWRETPESVVLRRLDGGEQVIPRADIADLSTPVSMMPPMDSILEPGQLRDLIAYLGTLKPKARK